MATLPTFIPPPSFPNDVIEVLMFLRLLPPWVTDIIQYSLIFSPICAVKIKFLLGL